MFQVMIVDYTSTMIVIHVVVLLKMINLGLGDTENSALRLLQQRYCNYCCDIEVEYFTTGYNKQSTASINTCIIMNCNSIWCENLSISMDLRATLVVIGTKLISILYYSTVLCIMWQYSATEM